MIRKFYYPEPLEGVEIRPAFHYRHTVEKGNGLFRDISYSFFQDSEVSDVTSADAIVLVHNFVKDLNDVTKAYIKKYADLAESLSLPIFVFSCGDWSDRIEFDSRVYVFRQSLYSTTMGARDIALPTTTEDPPAELLFLRPKQDKPMVAFCGQGDFKNKRRWVKYFAQNLWVDFRSLLDPHASARKIGVYWRRAMMSACKNSPNLLTNFIVRKTFSGHAHSVELDPKRARKEYLEASAHADFVLAPKGDGNYSNRFLKTLAFGRIPVFVDTDVVLPLESTIPYEKITVRVPMKDVHNTARYITDFYSSHSEEDWLECQKLAREMFLTYLVQEKFFSYFFSTFEKNYA